MNATDAEIESWISQVMAVSGRKGFPAWLGVELLEADRETGTVTVRAEVREDMTQHHGYVHGGVLGSLADIAMAWCGALVTADVLTHGYSLQFLAPAEGRWLLATATMIREGRRAVAVEARISTQNDAEEPTLVATAMGSIWRLDRP